jgi:hypothetical protein
MPESQSSTASPKKLDEHEIKAQQVTADDVAGDTQKTEVDTQQKAEPKADEIETKTDATSTEELPAPENTPTETVKCEAAPTEEPKEIPASTDCETKPAATEQPCKAQDEEQKSVIETDGLEAGVKRAADSDETAKCAKEE